mgnify:CR=1 FL=1
MYKRRAIDDGHNVLAEQPFAVLAFRAKRIAQRKVACGKLSVEPGARCLGITVIALCPGSQPSLAHFGSLFARERRVFIFADVTQVTDHVHRFVITDKYVNTTAC